MDPSKKKTCSRYDDVLLLLGTLIVGVIIVGRIVELRRRLQRRQGAVNLVVIRQATSFASGHYGRQRCVATLLDSFRIKIFEGAHHCNEYVF